MKKNLLFLLTILSITAFAQQDKKIFLTKSFDGTTFNNEIFLVDSADVPSIAQHQDGTVILAFQNFKRTFGPTNVDRIGIRKSNDSGFSWSPSMMINLSGYTGTSTRVFDPTITITPDSLYRMYFSYCPNVSGSLLDSTCDTYSAISSDGINYTFEPSARVSVSNKTVIDPAAVYFSGIWHYYSPNGAPQDGARHATSVNGLNFTIIDSAGYGDLGRNWTGNVINNGTNMRFYGGSDDANQKKLWWNATTDGSNWSGYTWTNLFGKDPGVVKLNTDEYLALVPSDSNTTILTTTNISQVENDEQILVYPNPTTNNLYIKNYSDNPIQTIEIYSLQGQLIKTIQTNNDNFIKIDCSDLKPGVYFSKMNTKKKAFTERFLKK